MFLSKTSAVVAIGLAVAALSCTDEKPPAALDGEVMFRLSSFGDSTGAEDFIAVTTEEAVIARARQELSLPDSERTYHIHGKVGLGNGGFNLDWGWHFITDEWVLVQESTEICDTSPSAIQATIGKWRDTVTVFCPLLTYVAEEVR